MPNFGQVLVSCLPLFTCDSSATVSASSPFPSSVYCLWSLPSNAATAGFSSSRLNPFLRKKKKVCVFAFLFFLWSLRRVRACVCVCDCWKRARMSSLGTENGTQSNATVDIKNLCFTYPGVDGQPPPGSKPLIEGLTMSLHEGDRCLLIGANGAGKTTLLKIIGGKHMVEPSMVRILGRSAFHDTTLVSTGQLSYLGGEWKRDVAFAGFDVPMQMDVSARKLIFGIQGVDSSRRDRLIEVLDIDLSWRMHMVSDGQRRRVQICMGLLIPFKVLLLDEITVDLDVLGRSQLMKFLTSECKERKATIIYATHIFDGLENWPTHIAYVARGRLQLMKPLSEIPELQSLSLMRTVEKWLRAEVEEERRRRKDRKALGLPERERSLDGTRVTGGPVPLVNNGWGNGRLTPTVAGHTGAFDLSSNRVLRM